MRPCLKETKQNKQKLQKDKTEDPNRQLFGKNIQMKKHPKPMSVTVGTQLQTDTAVPLQPIRMAISKTQARTTVEEEVERRGYHTWLPVGDTRAKVQGAWFIGSPSHEAWSYHPLNSALNKALA